VVGDDGRGDIRLGAAAAKPGRQLGFGPAAAREQIARRQAGGLEIEGPPGRADGSLLERGW
jgi:hypothetical protein